MCSPFQHVRELPETMVSAVLRACARGTRVRTRSSSRGFGLVRFPDEQTPTEEAHTSPEAGAGPTVRTPCSSPIDPKHTRVHLARPSEIFWIQQKNLLGSYLCASLGLLFSSLAGCMVSCVQTARGVVERARVCSVSAGCAGQLSIVAWTIKNVIFFNVCKESC
jgi:hypothetical protein